MTSKQNNPQWLVMLYLAGDDYIAGSNPNDHDLRSAVAAVLNKIDTKRFNENNLHLYVCIDGLYGLKGEAIGKIGYLEGGKFKDLTHDLLQDWDTVWKEQVSVSPYKYKVNSGTRNLLFRFVNWALDRHRTEPDKVSHKMLAIVSHGGGWSPFFGAGEPHGHANNSPGGRGMPADLSQDASFSTWELGRELENALYFENRIEPLDILFFDTCLMGMIECAYEVRECAKYLIAGENLLWSELTYEKHLNPEVLKKGDPLELAKYIVENYIKGHVKQLRFFAPFAIAALDLEQIQDLAKEVGELARSLTRSLDPSEDHANNFAAIKTAYDLSQKFDNNADLQIDKNESFVDLLDFSLKLAQSEKLPKSVIEPAKAVVQKIGTKNRRVWKIENNGYKLIQDKHPDVISNSVVVAMEAVGGPAPVPTNGKLPDWPLYDAYGLSIYLPINNELLPYHLHYLDRTEKISQLDAYISLDQHYPVGSQLSFLSDTPDWGLFVKCIDEYMREHSLRPLERILRDFGPPYLLLRPQSRKQSRASGSARTRRSK